MRLNNKSGIILIVVLWVLAILSLLAIGLSRRTSVELALTKHSIGKLRSKYIAIAGLMHALEKIDKDNKNKETRMIDTKFACGFFLKENQEKEDLFKAMEVGSGHFDIYSLQEGPSGEKEYRYGFSDEDSKISVNTIQPKYLGVLKELFLQMGKEEDLAEKLASSILDLQEGAEEAGGLKTKRKIHSLEELLLVPEMTEEIFGEAKGFLTIFPKQGKFFINMDTAQKPVLLALTRHFVGGKTNTTRDDADSLVEKMVTYRNGEDGLWATEDDRVLDANEMALNAKERILLSAVGYNAKKVSHYLRVFVKAIDDKTNVSSQIEAIIARENMSVVYWHRN